VPDRTGEEPHAGDAARRLEQAGQGHLVLHARTLLPFASGEFLGMAAGFPWEEIERGFRHPPPPPPPTLRPPQALTWKRQEREPGLRRRLADLGWRFLAGGRVATVLLAGGQGTRLGADVPKGCLVLGPEPDRTLYRVHAERVAAVGRRAGRAVPLFVVVSGATEEPTRRAFADPAAFGLEPGQVRFVVQRELPALDDEGRALLAAPGRLATAPDGHGGFLRVMLEDGTLDGLLRDGFDALTTFQVDNPLALPLDPVMLGWMVERRAHAVGKAVRKRDPSEKVGVYARDLEGRHRIVEYSEVPAEGLPPEVVLGSIALHGFALRWLVETLRAPLDALPLHRARKKVPFLASDGRVEQPSTPNAWKLERFVFDLLPHAPRVEVHEVAREREFAPIKNATGEDSPETARALVEAEARRRAAEGAEDDRAPDASNR
jgi:UDP-N-acetylglucosamine/UDP-N-acetylgalactosamine diphosphorylase